MKRFLSSLLLTGLLWSTYSLQHHAAPIAHTIRYWMRSGVSTEFDETSTGSVIAAHSLTMIRTGKTCLEEPDLSLRPLNCIG